MEFDLFEKLSDLETKVYILRQEIEQKDDYIKSLLEKISELEKTRVLEPPISTERSVTPIPDTTSVPVADTSPSGAFKDVVSIADTLKEASNSVMENVGYTFDERTGLYHDSKSGYYYDPDNQLFYEPTRGVYYTYNSETNEYTYHSSCDRAELRKKFNEAVAHRSAQQRIEDKIRKLHESDSGRRRTPSPRHSRSRRYSSRSPSSPYSSRRYRHRRDHDYDERRRSCSRHSRRRGDRRRRRRYSSSNSPSSSSSSRGRYCRHRSRSHRRTSRRRSRSSSLRKRSCSYSPADRSKSPSPPMVELKAGAHLYPPTLRLVILASDFAAKGSVFQLTKSTGVRNWGCIGRSVDLSPVLNFPKDKSLSAIHCELFYNESDRTYSLVNYNTSSGTFLNQRKLDENEKCPIQHGNDLRISSTQMLVHIHERQESCSQCNEEALQLVIRQEEAVLGNDPSDDQLSLQEQRVKFLDGLKEKYGLKLPKLPVNKDSLGNYKDRASSRRSTQKQAEDAGLVERESFVSSKPPTSTADSDAPMSVENKGAKLLSKMGWAPGQGLGKNETGILEPISARQRIDSRGGLGSESDRLALPTSASSKDVERARRANVTRQRYMRAS